MAARLRMRRGIGPWLVAAICVSGCKGPAALFSGAQEGIVHARSGLGQESGVHLLKLRGADGQPISALSATVDGRVLPIKDGVLAVPDSIFQEALRLDNLLILAPGYVPVRLTPDAAIAGIDMSPLAIVGQATLISEAGGTVTGANGAIKLAIPAGLVDQEPVNLTLGSYVPNGQLDALSLAYQQDLTKLYATRRLSAPASSACAAPFACLPIKQALGLSITIDGAIGSAASGGTIVATYDLSLMLQAGMAMAFLLGSLARPAGRMQ